MSERFWWGMSIVFMLMALVSAYMAGHVGSLEQTAKAQPIPAPIAWDPRMFTVTIVDPNLSMDPIVCLPRRNHTLDCRDVLGWTGEQ